MTIEKSKAIKLTAIVFAVLTIFAAIFTAIYFVRQDAPIADNTLNVENENGFDNTKTYAMPKTMAFTAKSLAAAQANGQTVDVKIKASVSPWDAANQAVDYSIAWGVAPTHGKETVTDYVTVTPTVDGAKTATVTCLKAFGEQIKITVTARENPNATASCLLDYKQQLLSYDLSVAQAGKSPTVNVSRKTGKLVADVESDNEINFGYSYSKSDVYTVALNDSEIAKPTAMSLSYKSALSSAMNKVKENAAGKPIATATENGFKVAGYLNKNAVDGLSIENHNKIIAAINSNYYYSTIVTLNDADGNTLVKYTFDTDTSLIKKQGIVESLAMDRSNFEFGDKDKTYTITYLCGKSTSKLGLFEVGSEHGNSRLADGVYPTSYAGQE